MILFRLRALLCRLAGALLLALALPGAGRAAEPAVATLKPGVLSVCLFATFPPFASLDESGQWVGWDIDFMKDFAARHALAFAPVLVKDYDGFWNAPGADRCDIAASGIADLAYRRAATGTRGVWSDHYYHVVRAFGVRADDAVTGIQDFAGRTVMVVAGSTADLDARDRVAQAKVPDVTIIGTSDDVENARRVHRGGPDAPFAFGSGLGTVEYLVAKFGGMKVVWPHCLMMPDGTLAGEPFSFVVRAQSTGLIAALNAFIAHPSRPYAGGAGPACPD